MDFTLKMNLDSADAQDDEGRPYGPAIAGYLRDVANRVEEGFTDGPIRDVVHKIGEFAITDD